jgi:hypothetical protein
LLLDPSLDQLADAAIDALVTGLFQSLNISPDLFWRWAFFFLWRSLYNRMLYIEPLCIL